MILLSIYLISVLVVLIFMLIEYRDDKQVFWKCWKYNLFLTLFPVVNTLLAIACVILWILYFVVVK